jgi:hypothetical protein
MSQGGQCQDIGLIKYSCEFLAGPLGIKPLFLNSYDKRRPRWGQVMTTSAGFYREETPLGSGNDDRSRGSIERRPLGSGNGDLYGFYREETPVGVSKADCRGTLSKGTKCLKTQNRKLETEGWNLKAGN